jgi:hypothetical protein
MSYPFPSVGGDQDGEELIMLIDCDGCAVRGPGCPDCVVTVLLGATPHRVELDEVECRALAVLADGGLVPPLRLVAAEKPPETPQPPPKARRRTPRDGRETGELAHRSARHAAG